MVELSSLGRVLRHALASVVHAREEVTAARFPAVARLLVELGAFALVLRHAFPLVVLLPKVYTSPCFPAVARLLVELSRLLGQLGGLDPVAGYAQADEVHEREVREDPAIRVPIVAGLLVERHSLGVTVLHAIATLIHDPELVTGPRVPTIAGLLEFCR